jgi:uncharacterized membrane protein YgcG
MKNIALLLLLITSFGSYAQSIEDQINKFSERLKYPTMERILHFHSDVKIQKDCSVKITERIVANVTGDEFKRGIFRDIPLTYDKNGGSYHVLFNLDGVKRDGREESYKTEMLSNGIRIYVGKENVFLNRGVHIFEISYVVENVLLFYDDHDEFYWNVNGNGWDFSTDSISATIYYPKGAHYLQHDGFTGEYGSSEKEFRVEKSENSITYIGLTELYSNQCLTVAVGWDKGHLSYPTFLDKILFFIRTYAIWFLGLLGILIGLSFNFIMWRKYGIDPKPGTIIPRFYAPEGLSPAECAYLDNEGRETDTMFGSMLLILASKGWIELTRKSGDVYYVTKPSSKGKQVELTEIEQKFHDKLMVKDVVYIIKNKYNARLSRASNLLTNSIDAKQTGTYYVRNSFLKTRQYIFPAITLLLCLIAMFKMGGSGFIVALAVGLHLIINWFFGRLYEQPTKKGRQVMDEIQGFKMYMKYANKDQIKLMNPPSMEFKHFEENLSFAVALGVAKEWAGQFDQETLRQANSGGMPYMHGIAFMHFGHFSSFGSEISTAISSAQTPPSAASGGGGFSGGGGGGFSGGGFGGGGGGGW